MRRHVKRTLLLLFGGLFFLIGIVGVFLPILPTTPFMILSAACFAESSPRFHKMLLNNRWFGQDLQQWEANRTMKRATKKRATWVIVLSFSVSILILWGSYLWQVALISIAILLLFFMWRIDES